MRVELLWLGKPNNARPRDPPKKGEPNSVPTFLKMLDPKLTKQFALARQVPQPI